MIEVELPDGRILEVNAPDSGTAARAAAPSRFSAVGADVGEFKGVVILGKFGKTPEDLSELDREVEPGDRPIRLRGSGCGPEPCRLPPELFVGCLPLQP